MGEVADAIEQPILTGNRQIGDEALELATQATKGYPFLIQLVGYHSWRQHPKEVEISLQDVEAGIPAAKRRMGAMLYGPELEGLSEIDRSFLLAMAVDEGPSAMSDLVKRLECDKNYASQYRRRLLAATVITEAGYGKVDFAIPYLRDYLREHVATEVNQLSL
jgi:hypothetical protein